MFCPNDKTEMHRVKIVSNYGQPIILDQCGKCGGIWFDESELFRAKQGEAEKIELLDTEILQNPTAIDNPTLICPRDQTVLSQFTDKYFPKDIILVRCLSCNGIWLNRGIFTKYQKFRQELMRPKEKSPEDKEREENIRQLVAAYQSGHSNETLERLGKFLSTPVDGDTSTLPSQAENAISIALNIIMTILRAFIFKF